MLSNRGEHIHFFIVYRNIAVLLTLELWFPFRAAAVIGGQANIQTAGTTWLFSKSVFPILKGSP